MAISFILIMRVMILKLLHIKNTKTNYLVNFCITYINITIEQRAWAYILLSPIHHKWGFLSSCGHLGANNKIIRTNVVFQKNGEGKGKEKRPTQFCQRTWQEQKMHAKTVFIEPRDLRRLLFRTGYSRNCRDIGGNHA